MVNTKDLEENLNAFRISPNPVSNEAEVQINLIEANELNIQVLNMLGQFNLSSF